MPIKCPGKRRKSRWLASVASRLMPFYQIYYEWPFRFNIIALVFSEIEKLSVKREIRSYCFQSNNFKIHGFIALMHSECQAHFLCCTFSKYILYKGYVMLKLLQFSVNASLWSWMCQMDWEF